MLDCPYCDQPVIEGSDECESCGHPLYDTHLPAPQSEVELGLLTDRLVTSQSRWPGSSADRFNGAARMAAWSAGREATWFAQSAKTPPNRRSLTT